MFSLCRARLVDDTSSGPKQRGSSPKSPTEGPAQDRVVIDPTKGGAVAPKAESKSKALEVQPGTWVWDGLVKLLEVDLFSAAWEVRHGAAMALREVLKLQGKYGGMKAELSWDEKVHNGFHLVLQTMLVSLEALIPTLCTEA